MLVWMKETLNFKGNHTWCYFHTLKVYYCLHWEYTLIGLAHLSHSDATIKSCFFPFFWKQFSCVALAVFKLMRSACPCLLGLKTCATITWLKQFLLLKYILCLENYVHVCLQARRGCQIPLQMFFSHHVDSGTKLCDLWKNRLTAEPSSYDNLTFLGHNKILTFKMFNKFSIAIIFNTTALFFFFGKKTM